MACSKSIFVEVLGFIALITAHCTHHTPRAIQMSSDKTWIFMRNQLLLIVISFLLLRLGFDLVARGCGRVCLHLHAVQFPFHILVNCNLTCFPSKLRTGDDMMPPPPPPLHRQHMASLQWENNWNYVGRWSGWSWCKRTMMPKWNINNKLLCRKRNSICSFYGSRIRRMRRHILYSWYFIICQLFLSHATQTSNIAVIARLCTYIRIHLMLTKSNRITWANGKCVRLNVDGGSDYA